VTYQQISLRATSEWQALPEPNPRGIGYFLASGQVQFATRVGYIGGSHFQERISKANAKHATKRGN